ncbi:hypothetical protein [Winogradskyella flava]|uniref:hypothetical protein n=1 Tax=Winogradskyella flava TaxID=1884876 RepID=UPI002491EE30|nr:hypothetical protein [Winogradskyella flava]
MKKLFYTFTIILFFSCEKKRNIEFFNESRVFHYKLRNGIDKPTLKDIVSYYSKDYAIELIKTNDTIIQIHGTHHTNKDDYGFLGAWVSIKDYSTADLNCETKVIFNQNEFQYSFCRADLVEFFDKQIIKSKKDIKFLHYIEKKEKLLKYRHGIDSSITDGSEDYLLSTLIMNVPFSIYDKYKKNEISKVCTVHFKTGNLGSMGYDHFYLDKKNDTIASISLVYLMH